MEEIQNLKTAVIGVGSLGQHHARNYAELAATGKGEFVGVCDVNEKNARQIAEKNNCAFFTDWRELLDKTDAVSIVTPTDPRMCPAGTSVMVTPLITRASPKSRSSIDASCPIRVRSTRAPSREAR